MKAVAITDTGLKRSINQDYVFCRDTKVGNLPNLFVVADGMGGHKAGDLASRFTVDTLVSEIEKSDSDNPISVIGDAIKTTNTKLIAKAAELGYEYFTSTLFVSPYQNHEELIRICQEMAKKYGVELSEIKGELIVDQQKNIVDGKVYLSNGLTYEQYLGKICDEFNIDKEPKKESVDYKIYRPMKFNLALRYNPFGDF